MLFRSDRQGHRLRDCFPATAGSLRVVADESGNVIKEVLYAPFGGIIEDSNLELRIPIGFAGGLHDRNLGFVRFGWRDYDTFTSRWTAPDTMNDGVWFPWLNDCHEAIDDNLQEIRTGEP